MEHRNIPILAQMYASDQIPIGFDQKDYDENQSTTTTKENVMIDAAEITNFCFKPEEKHCHRLMKEGVH